MWGWVALAVFIVFIIIIYLLSPLISPKTKELKDSHILITGGSSGIGKALAIQAVRQGARVTLVARNKVKLEETRAEILQYSATSGNHQRVEVVSLDLSQDYPAIEAALQQVETVSGPVDFLINCAGTACPGKFLDQPISEFKRMIDMNYMSAVHATRALLPAMKDRGQGRIVFVSSQAGQLGIFGFSAYSASKFALRGLAEALQMEVKPFNVCITLAFPPDTDTPGFHEEQKTKPQETKLISETSGLFNADSVALVILKDAVQGRFFSSVGLDGLMLSNLTCGFSPVTSLMEATQQVLSMSIFRIISLFYLSHFDSIVSKCHQQQQQQIGAEKEHKKHL